MIIVHYVVTNICLIHGYVNADMRDMRDCMKIL
jgi:hypothetical protein